MSVEESIATTRRIFDEIWNQGNLEVADELFDASSVAHGQTFDLPPGPEGFKQSAAIFRNAFPDMRMTIDDPIGSGDRVAARWTVRATHQGEMMGISATGKEVEVTGIIILRFSGGKVVETWDNWDGLGLMRQLGVLPPVSQRGT